jgi:hypothetical protein
MSYILKYSDNTNNKKPIEVQDKGTDDTTDLLFLGMGRTPYGEIFQTNMLHLLENFAGPTPPKGIEGQLWYNNSGQGSLKIFKAVGDATGSWDDVGGGGTGDSYWSNSGGTISTTSTTSHVTMGTSTTNTSLTVNGPLTIDNTDPNEANIIGGNVEFSGNIYSSDAADEYNGITYASTNKGRYFITRSYLDKYSLDGVFSNSGFTVNKKVETINAEKTTLKVGAFRIAPYNSATFDTDNILTINDLFANKDSKSSVYNVLVANAPNTSKVSYVIKLPAPGVDTVQGATITVNITTLHSYFDKTTHAADKLIPLRTCTVADVKHDRDASDVYWNYGAVQHPAKPAVATTDIETPYMPYAYQTLSVEFKSVLVATDKWVWLANATVYGTSNVPGY